MSHILARLYAHHDYLKNSNVLTDVDREYWNRISTDMDEVDIAMAIYNLCDYIFRYHGKKVIILLDEYDTPQKIKMQFEELLRNRSIISQIDEKRYEQLLLDHGVGKERIRKYGFAFRGKEVLIG